MGSFIGVHLANCSDVPCSGTSFEHNAARPGVRSSSASRPAVVATDFKNWLRRNIDTYLSWVIVVDVAHGRAFTLQPRGGTNVTTNYTGLRLPAASE